MQVKLMFRDMPPSTGLHQAAERWLGRLEQVHGGIVDCRVTIEQPHAHRQAASFRIQIVLELPDHRLGLVHPSSKDAYVALADAFREIRRKLLQHVAQHPELAKPPAVDYAVAFKS